MSGLFCKLFHPITFVCPDISACQPLRHLLTSCTAPPKTTFGGRRPLVEDNFWWKMIYSGRLPAVEEKLQWKITLGGRRPLVEDNLEDYQRWKMNISGRRPSLDPCMLPTPLRGIFFVDPTLNYLSHFCFLDQIFNLFNC